MEYIGEIYKNPQSSSGIRIRSNDFDKAAALRTWLRINVVNVAYACKNISNISF